MQAWLSAASGSTVAVIPWRGREVSGRQRCAFVDEAFGPAAKADTLEMVEGIKVAMKQDIAAASWMSDETKRAAEVKLQAVTDRIGYPDKWLDYSSVKIGRDDALGNLQRAGRPTSCP